MEQNISLQEYFKIIWVFIPAKKYIKYFSCTTRIDLWKYNGVSEKNIGNTTKSDGNFAPTFFDHHILTDTHFNGLCLNNIYIPKKVINIYNSYELNPWVGNLNTDFALNNCLFGSVKLTKKADLDKFNYGGYGIGFDSCSGLWFRDRSMRKNVILFDADMRSSLHIDNKNRNILILGEGPTQRLHNTKLTGEAKYLISFT